MKYNEKGRLLQLLSPEGELYQEEDLATFSPSELGVVFLHSVFFTTREYLEKNRGLLKRILRATMRGWLFCRENEEACVKTHPVADAHATYQLRNINEITWPSPEGLGYLSKGAWDDQLGVGGLDFPHVFTDTKLSDAEYATQPVAVDNSLILELHEDALLKSQDVYGLGWNQPPFFFCAPPGSTAYDICKGFAHTPCPAGEEAVGREGVDAVLCAPCPLGSFVAEFGRGQSCSPCPGRTHSTESGTVACSDCPPGTAASPTACATCPIGTFAAADGDASCQDCAAGTFINKEGQAKCELCPPGKFQSGTGETMCEDCAAGTFTDNLGMSGCTICEAGSSSSVGSSECTRCEVGSYAAEGQGECTSCPTDQTTLYFGATTIEDCLCGAGLESVGDGCRACGEGLSCEGFGEPVTVLPGFYAKMQGQDWDVYKCMRPSPNVCPGGGVESCMPNRGDLVCGRCDAGHYQEDANCFPCDGGKLGLVIFVALLGVAVCIVLYYISNIPKKKQPG